MEIEEAKNWLNQALKLAEKARDQDEVPVGALVVKDHEIVGQGYNQREQNHNPIHHAEIMAIESASQTLQTWRLSGCHLIVTLEPCLMCLGAIQQARIETVYFGAYDRKAGAVSLGFHFHQDERLNHRFKAVCLDDPSSGLILSQFFKGKRGR